MKECRIESYLKIVIECNEIVFVNILILPNSVRNVLDFIVESLLSKQYCQYQKI